MAGGLSYESWTDAPIGMQAAQADKIIERFRNASSQVGVVMKETPAAPPVAAASATNGDRIRAMNDDLLADFLDNSNNHICDSRTKEQCESMFALNCKTCILDWLHSPAKEDI